MIIKHTYAELAWMSSAELGNLKKLHLERLSDADALRRQMISDILCLQEVRDSSDWRRKSGTEPQRQRQR